MQDRLAPLIEERAPWLRAPAARPLRRTLEHLLHYPACVDLARTLQALPAPKVMDTMASRIACDVTLRGLHRLPATGPALIVANHPTGIADGLVLWHTLRRLRGDGFFFANRDVLRVLPQLEQVIVPVEWRQDLRTHAKTRATLHAATQALQAGRVGVIFPSGRLAKRRGLRLEERPWMQSAATLARRFGVPLVPVHIAARNSALFYGFDALHPSLRDITLFHEVLNKDRQPFRVTIGRPLDPVDLPRDAQRATQMLRDRVLDLAPRRDRRGPGHLDLLRTSRGYAALRRMNETLRTT